LAAVDGLFAGIEGNGPTRLGFRPSQRSAVSLTGDDLLVMALRPQTGSESIEELATSSTEFQNSAESVDGVMSRFAGIRRVFDSI
jgi:hypothetical protein